MPNLRQAFTPDSEDRARLIDVPGSSDFPDEVSINLDDKDPNNFEIVEFDETPEEDRGRPTTIHRSLADQEDDLRGMGERTKKRIDRLKFETHTERRGREQAERERDEAVSFARQQQAELTELRRRGDTNTAALAASMTDRNKEALTSAQRRLADAHTDGDSAAIASAMSDIAQLQAEAVAIRTHTPAPRAESERAPVAQAQPAAPQSQLAPNVTAWISHNRDWFQRPGYEARTKKALSLHYDIESRGIRPESPEYTRELDKGLRAVYPDHEPYEFSPDDGDGRGARREPRRTNVVTEGSRASESQQSQRTITLSNQQMALARRLKITPQAYAKEFLKQQQREAGKSA